MRFLGFLATVERGHILYKLASLAEGHLRVPDVFQTCTHWAIEWRPGGAVSHSHSAL